MLHLEYRNIRVKMPLERKKVDKERDQYIERNKCKRETEDKRLRYTEIQ